MSGAKPCPPGAGLTACRAPLCGRHPGQFNRRQAARQKWPSGSGGEGGREGGSTQGGNAARTRWQHARADAGYVVGSKPAKGPVSAGSAWPGATGACVHFRSTPLPTGYGSDGNDGLHSQRASCARGRCDQSCPSEVTLVSGFVCGRTLAPTATPALSCSYTHVSRISSRISAVECLLFVLVVPAPPQCMRPQVPRAPR